MAKNIKLKTSIIVMKEKYEDPTDLMIDYEKMGGDSWLKMFYESIGAPLPTLRYSLNCLEIKMEHGKVYTKGKSFRALAEAHARKYRAEVLFRRDYDEYGHKLIERDARARDNFLPSLKETIFVEVKSRKDKGKGINLYRTLGNLLSSQAMCFNLFVPLKNNLPLATRVFRYFIPNLDFITDIEIEKTPCNELLNDQSKFGGVDSDVYIKYLLQNGEQGVLLIETKYVEKEFSVCGHRKNKKFSIQCPDNTIVKNPSDCTYKHRDNNKFKYWDRTFECDAFDLDKLTSMKCPFGDSKWQLWVNQVLASQLNKEQNKESINYKFVVLAPEKNKELISNNIINEFQNLLKRKEVFEFVTIERIIEIIESEIKEDDLSKWVDEFKKKYLF